MNKALKRGVLILLMTIALTAFILLACGPAAPLDDNPVGTLPIQAQQEEPTRRPTRTPYPTDFVKPAELPPPTPVPPLPTENPNQSAQQGGNVGVKPDLAGDVTAFTREHKERGNFDAVVRVRVTGHRTVPKDTTVDWPVHNPPYVSKQDGSAYPWYFQDIAVVETYYGELPEAYSLIEVKINLSPSWAVGEEYIVFVLQAAVAEDAPEGIGGWRFNEEQLAAFGGIAGFLESEQAWALDGTTAWKSPTEGDSPFTPGSDLAAAKATGDSLSVDNLVAAIKAGLR